MMARRGVRHFTLGDVDDAVDRRGELDVVVVEKDDLVGLVEHRDRHGIVDLKRCRDLDRLFRLSHLDRGPQASAAHIAQRKRDSTVWQGEDVVPIAAELLDRGGRLVEDVEREAVDAGKVNREETLHEGVYSRLLCRQLELKPLDRGRFTHFYP